MGNNCKKDKRQKKKKERKAEKKAKKAAEKKAKKAAEKKEQRAAKIAARQEEKEASKSDKDDQKKKALTKLGLKKMPSKSSLNKLSCVQNKIKELLVNCAKDILSKTN